MTFQPGANLYTAGFGIRPENVEVPHIEARDPSTTDINFPIGKHWLNTVSQNEFTLYSFTSSGGITQANWAAPVHAIPDPLVVGAFTATGPVNLATTTDLAVNIGNANSLLQILSLTSRAIQIGVGGSPNIEIGSDTSISQIRGDVTFHDAFVSIADPTQLHPTLLIDTPLAFSTSNGRLVGPTTYNAIGCEAVFECNTSSGAITINMPTVIQTGTVFMVYDISGNASTNNITVNAPAGFNFFMAGLSPVSAFVMSHDYESLVFIVAQTSSNIVVLSNITGI